MIAIFVEMLALVIAILPLVVFVKVFKDAMDK